MPTSSKILGNKLLCRHDQERGDEGNSMQPLESSTRHQQFLPKADLFQL